MSLQAEARIACKALRSRASDSAQLALALLIEGLASEAARWQRRYLDETARLKKLLLLDRAEREQRDGALAMLRGLVGTCDEGTFDEVTRALWEAKRFIAMADNNWFELPKRVEGEVVQFKRRDA